MEKIARWVPLFVLPNIQMDTAIECGSLALVPDHDERIRNLMSVYSNFRRFLLNFKDPFGNRIHPALIVGKRQRHKYRADAIGSFRDAVAISALSHANALSQIYGRSHGFNYTDWFTLYSWMIDKDYEHIISRTPAQMHLHEVKALRPQSSPDFSARRLEQRDIDWSLLSILLIRWKSRYGTAKPNWEDRALFRSLNMAYAAGKMPGGPEAQMLDSGRSLALWVSAFEILARPADDKSSYSKVIELFDRVEWLHRTMYKKKHKVRFGKKVRSATLCAWIYRQLHEKRNDFIHGNPIMRGSLLVRRSRRYLPIYAAPLYRAALTGFLDLRWKVPPPKEMDALIQHVHERGQFRSPQGVVERALMSIKTKPKR